MDKLAVSEHFYSVQGEGRYVGVPSVFLRLKGCNLTCGGINSVATKELDSGATWRCDTMEVWLTGESLSISSIFDLFESNGYIESLKNGAHLIITGGEPLLQSKQLIHFFNMFFHKYSFVPFVEIETNGTVMVNKDLDKYVSQYNVSFKLSNSGMPVDRRVNENVIRNFLTKNNTIYKFVVSSEKEVEEVFNDFVNLYSFKLTDVFLMPAASTRKELLSLEPYLIEICKKKCVNYSTRLHIHVWDKLTGV